MKKICRSIFILNMLISAVTFVKAQGPVDSTLAPFYHGVASGDPTSTEVTLWTRVTSNSPGNVKVKWRVATDTLFTNIVDSGTVTAKSTTNFTINLIADGLQPDKWYYYQFSALNKYSITGRTKTLPTGTNVDSVRLAIISCTNYQNGYFNVYESITNRNDVDAVVHLGDYIYEYKKGGFGYDAAVGRPHKPQHEAVSKNDYRMRYQQYKLDPQTRKLHQQYPFICIWDDHEVANNAYKDGAENHDPNTEGDWYTRLYNAKTAYFEWMPVRKPDPNGDSLRLYRNFTFGNLIDLEVLDTRLQGRTIQLATGDSHFNDTDRTIMGIAQRNWLFNKLNTSTGKWNIIGQQVMVAPLLAFGAIVNDDQWDGYPAERNRLYNSLQQNSSKNLVFLTGDIHSGWANDLPLAGYSSSNRSASAAVEFVTPSVSSPNPLTSLSPTLIKASNSHVRYVDLSYFGYAIINATKTRLQSDYYAISTVKSLTYTTSYKAGWFVNPGEHFLRQGSGATVRSNNKKAPLAPALPMVFVSPRFEEPAIDNHLIVFQISPNPAIDKISIQFYLDEKAAVNFSITDLEGRKVKSIDSEIFETGLLTHSIDISELRSGTYLITLETKKGHSTKMFVK